MKLIIFTLLIIQMMYANISDKQLEVLSIVYHSGKKYRANDGMSFEKTLCAIYLTESSAGKYIIGDKYTKTGKLKSLYLSSLGPGQIKLETALIVLNRHKYLQRRFKIKAPTLRQYYQYNRLIKLREKYLNQLLLLRKVLRYSQDSKIISKIRTISNNLNAINNSLYHSRSYIQEANIIINKLLTNINFSVAISASYLIDNYEFAKRKKLWNPYLKSISRYNGGWMNYKYIKRVMRNLKYVRKLIKQRRIK